MTNDFNEEPIQRVIAQISVGRRAIIHLKDLAVESGATEEQILNMFKEFEKEGTIIVIELLKDTVIVRRKTKH